MQIQPRNNRIYVAFNRAESNILLPDQSTSFRVKPEDPNNWIEVLAVAPDVTLCAVGDSVLLHPQTNFLEMTRTPRQTFLVDASSVLAVLPRDPSSLSDTLSQN